jgi:V/A-type H+-transporting ATPase subunit K
MILTITLLIGLALVALTIAFAPKQHNQRANVQTVRKLVLGLGGFNLVLALMMIGLGLVWLFAPGTVQAAESAQQASQDPYATLAAAIAVGLGSIGAAYAVGATGSAAIGTIAEKPEAFGRVLIFVGLAEGIAIYGLIIAFMILGR